VRYFSFFVLYGLYSLVYAHSIPSSAASRFLAPSTSAAFIEETTGCVVSLQSRRSGSSLLVEAPSKKALEQALFDLERVVAKVEDGWKLPA
jgi:hypothetical protein